MPEPKKPTKKALLAAFRAEMGKCSSMIEETKECPNWGVEKVDDRAYCGQHVRAVFLAADKHRREVLAREAADARIDYALLWHRDHPSFSDLMPLGWTGE